MPTFFAEDPQHYKCVKTVIKPQESDEPEKCQFAAERWELPGFNVGLLIGNWDPSQKRVGNKKEEDEGTRKEVLYQSAKQLHRHLCLALSKA